MNNFSIAPVHHPFTATITPPGSKSLTNRALVIASLAGGDSLLSNVLFADDTLVMLEALGRLGFKLDIDRPAAKVRVHGASGKIPRASAELFCGNSGTTIRFLTALCTLGKGEFQLDGVPRMRQRPIGELLELLKHMGARVTCLLAPGYPPVKVHADGLPGGIVHFGAAKSSQFLSAALLIAPYLRHELDVHLASPQTSWPYVEMTMRLMDDFGVTPELFRDPATGEPRRIHVPRHPYAARAYEIEPDASSASYFLALAAIHPQSSVTVHGLAAHSLQGDVGFANLLARMGADVQMHANSITVTGTPVLSGIDIDLSPMPDTAQTLAVASLFADSPTTIRGLSTLRVKETDRLAALSTELAKLGAHVDVADSQITIRPPPKPNSLAFDAHIDTYDDHRMAMSFSLAATRLSGVTIKNPHCVAKTYPHYFDDLRKVLDSQK